MITYSYNFDKISLLPTFDNPPFGCGCGTLCCGSGSNSRTAQAFPATHDSLIPLSLFGSLLGIGQGMEKAMGGREYPSGGIPRTRNSMTISLVEEHHGRV